MFSGASRLRPVGTRLSLLALVVPRFLPVSYTPESIQTPHFPLLFIEEGKVSLSSCLCCKGKAAKAAIPQTLSPADGLFPEGTMPSIRSHVTELDVFLGIRGIIAFLKRSQVPMWKTQLLRILGDMVFA